MRSALVALALLLLPSSAATAPPQSPGRLLNQAQQQLAIGAIDEALVSLQTAISLRPQESFAWGLLAEALIWGKAEGDETVAAWEALAARHPDDGHRVVRVVRARMAAHRRDRFTHATTDWVATSEAQLAELTVSNQPVEVRYAALITLRDLLNRSGRPAEGTARGVEAWTLDPAPLQGRISRLLMSVQQGDLTTTTEVCLDILRTDPWAAEACSGLFSRDRWPQSPDEVVQARMQVLARIAELEEYIAEGEAIPEPPPGCQGGDSGDGFGRGENTDARDERGDGRALGGDEDPGGAPRQGRERGGEGEEAGERGARKRRAGRRLVVLETGM